MVPIQNVKMTVGLIWNTGGTETEIIVAVSVLGLRLQEVSLYGMIASQEIQKN